MSNQPKSLTKTKKLQAIEARYYQFLPWEPKKGDYYTSTRSDLELYRIVDIRAGVVFTEYCENIGNEVSEWDQQTFTTEGFGKMRIWVPDFIINS